MKLSKSKREIKLLTNGLKDQDYWSSELVKLKRPFENLLRKDRYHGLLHGDAEIDNSHKATIFDLTGEPGLNPEEVLLKRELFTQTIKALWDLNKKDLFIMNEMFIEEKTLTKVANELGININAVRKRKIKSLRILRQKLEKQGLGI